MVLLISIAIELVYLVLIQEKDLWDVHDYSVWAWVIYLCN